MPGFPRGLGNCFRKQCESSRGAAFPLLRLFIIATCSALLCHLRKYLNVNSVGKWTDYILKGIDSLIQNLSWEGPSNAGIILVVSVRCGAPDDMVTKRRTHWLAAIWRLWSPRRDTCTHGWETERREGQLLPPWSSSIPGTVLTFFYSCLQTRQAKQTATALVMFAQRNMNMLFLKRDMFLCQVFII